MCEYLPALDSLCITIELSTSKDGKQIYRVDVDFDVLLEYLRQDLFLPRVSKEIVGVMRELGWINDETGKELSDAEIAKVINDLLKKGKLSTNNIAGLGLLTLLAHSVLTTHKEMQKNGEKSLSYRDVYEKIFKRYDILCEELRDSLFETYNTIVAEIVEEVEKWFEKQYKGDVAEWRNKTYWEIVLYYLKILEKYYEKSYQNEYAKDVRSLIYNLENGLLEAADICRIAFHLRSMQKKQVFGGDDRSAKRVGRFYRGKFLPIIERVAKKIFSKIDILLYSGGEMEVVCSSRAIMHYIHQKLCEILSLTHASYYYQKGKISENVRPFYMKMNEAQDFSATISS